MRHTQGEWEVMPSDCMTASYVLINAYDYFEKGYESDDPQTAIALRQEDEANARLMTAAPDLLAACKYALPLIIGERLKNDAFPPDDDLGKYLAGLMKTCEKKLESVIKKAEGN